MMKVCVCDVDGTILNSHGELSDKTKASLIAFQQRGNILILASGRSYLRMMDVALTLKMDQYHGFLIDVNGTSLYRFETKSRERFAQLTEHHLLELFDYFMNQPVEMKFFCDDAIYTYLPQDIYELKMKIRKEMKLPVDYPWTSGEYGWLCDMRDGYPHQYLISDPTEIHHIVNKLSLCQEPDVLEKVKREFISIELSHTFEVAYSGHRQLDINNKGLNKGKSVARLLDELKVDSDDVYIFGDGENDLTMLNLSDNSYLMGNASQSLKKESYLVIASNDEDGVAKIIDTL